MKRTTMVAVAAFAAAGIAPASAAVIDFEGGADDQAITASTFSAQNVRFEAAEGVDLAFEKVGDDETDGFLYDADRAYDRAAENPGRLGDTFMRTGQQVSSRDLNGPVFSVAYDRAPTLPIGGEIWDIDGNSAQGTEQWAVQAYSSEDALIAEQISPEGTKLGAGTLDGRAWSFLFDGEGYDLGDIARIDFSFIGTKDRGIGLAFNNFETGAPVPLPAAAWFLITAVGGLVGARWLRSK